MKNKTSISKLLKILILVLLLVALLAGAIWWYFGWSDVQSNIRIATSISPFTADQQYVIKTNTWGEANTYYTFVPLNNEALLQGEGTLGRIVGNKTEVDLTEYLDKPVIMEGSFYFGKPIILNNSESDFVNQNQIVANITNIVLVE